MMVKSKQESILVLLISLCLLLLISSGPANAATYIRNFAVVNETNTRLLHHTNLFRSTPHMIVRRGYPMTFGVVLDSAVTTNQTITLQVAPYSVLDTKSISIKQISPTLYHIYTRIANDAPVGSFDIAAKLNVGNGFVYPLAKKLVILFNPWNPGDNVYFASPTLLQEYIENERGITYRGTSYNVQAVYFTFNQFNTSTLQVLLYWINSFNEKTRRDPGLLARELTAISTTQSAHWNGLMEGRWPENNEGYPGGYSPMSWTSSETILNLYIRQNYQTVKYSQCWIFSAVLNTLLRAIGIPTRMITAFDALHETPSGPETYHQKIYRYWDHRTRRQLTKGDKIWSFHAWNEIWIKNNMPLDAQYRDSWWNIVDSTPQEPSGGKFQLGPAPQKAVKNGSKTMKYDVSFVISEVNSTLYNYYVICPYIYQGLVQHLPPGCQITGQVSRPYIPTGTLLVTKRPGKDEWRSLTVTSQYHNRTTGYVASRLNGDLVLQNSGGGGLVAIGGTRNFYNAATTYTTTAPSSGYSTGGGTYYTYSNNINAPTRSSDDDGNIDDISIDSDTIAARRAEEEKKEYDEKHALHIDEDIVHSGNDRIHIVARPVMTTLSLASTSSSSTALSSSDSHNNNSNIIHGGFVDKKGRHLDNIDEVVLRIEDNTVLYDTSDKFPLPPGLTGIDVVELQDDTTTTTSTSLFDDDNDKIAYLSKESSIYNTQTLGAPLRDGRLPGRSRYYKPLPRGSQSHRRVPSTTTTCSSSESSSSHPGFESNTCTTPIEQPVYRSISSHFSLTDDTEYAASVNTESSSSVSSSSSLSSSVSLSPDSDNTMTTQSFVRGYGPRRFNNNYNHENHALLDAQPYTYNDHATQPSVSHETSIDSNDDDEYIPKYNDHEGNPVPYIPPTQHPVALTAKAIVVQAELGKPLEIAVHIGCEVTTVEDNTNDKDSKKKKKDNKSECNHDIQFDFRAIVSWISYTGQEMGIIADTKGIGYLHHGNDHFKSFRIISTEYIQRWIDAQKDAVKKRQKEYNDKVASSSTSSTTTSTTNSSSTTTSTTNPSVSGGGFSPYNDDTLSVPEYINISVMAVGLYGDALTTMNIRTTDLNSLHDMSTSSSSTSLSNTTPLSPGETLPAPAISISPPSSSSSSSSSPTSPTQPISTIATLSSELYQYELVATATERAMIKLPPLFLKAAVQQNPITINDHHDDTDDDDVKDVTITIDFLLNPSHEESQIDLEYESSSVPSLLTSPSSSSSSTDTTRSNNGPSIKYITYLNRLDKPLNTLGHFELTNVEIHITSESVGIPSQVIKLKQLDALPQRDAIDSSPIPLDTRKESHILSHTLRFIEKNDVVTLEQTQFEEPVVSTTSPSPTTSPSSEKVMTTETISSEVLPSLLDEILDPDNTNNNPIRNKQSMMIDKGEHLYNVVLISDQLPPLHASIIIII